MKNVSKCNRNMNDVKLLCAHKCTYKSPFWKVINNRILRHGILLITNRQRSIVRIEKEVIQINLYLVARSMSMVTNLRIFG